MATRYRVEYALKVHRKDNFIEWIKGLLAVPFTLQTGHFADKYEATKHANETLKRYATVLRDVEYLINSHIEHIRQFGERGSSRLKMLVPSITNFWTPLPLERAMYILEPRLCLAKRRFVAPSFNDVRYLLGAAQLLYLAENGLDMVTFDGDVTLYEDGQPLISNNPVISRLLHLLREDKFVTILTAAGYPSVTGREYSDRFSGLLSAVEDSDLTDVQKKRLHVLGGESNYLFRYEPSSGLTWIEPEEWSLPQMLTWSREDCQRILDVAELCFKKCIEALNMDAVLVRKERSVGLVPKPGHTFRREQLEEAVLDTQSNLLMENFSIPFTAFNGGNDIWCDIGDKKLGVQCLQAYFGVPESSRCLHVGDQFLSVGHNDYKARAAATTVWVSSPTETIEMLDYYFCFLDKKRSGDSLLKKHD